MLIDIPGFEIGLLGAFDQGSMVEARPVEISGFSCTDGRAGFEPVVGDFLGDDVYTRDVATTDSLSSQPLLSDPLERIFVEVRKSSIPSAGEGLFLKKDAKVVLYNFMLNSTSTLGFRHYCTEAMPKPIS